MASPSPAKCLRRSGAKANLKHLGVPVGAREAGVPYRVPPTRFCREAWCEGTLQAGRRSALPWPGPRAGRPEGRVARLLSREDKWSDGAIALRRWCLTRRSRAAVAPCGDRPASPVPVTLAPGRAERGGGGQRVQPAWRIHAGGAGTAGLG